MVSCTLNITIYRYPPVMPYMKLSITKFYPVIVIESQYCLGTTYTITKTWSGNSSRIYTTMYLKHIKSFLKVVILASS